MNNDGDTEVPETQRNNGADYNARQVSEFFELLNTSAHLKENDSNITSESEGGIQKDESDDLGSLDQSSNIEEKQQPNQSNLSVPGVRITRRRKSSEGSTKGVAFENNKETGETDVEAVDAEKLAGLAPDDPLLGRVQKVLYKQLTDANARLEEELREKNEALKHATLERETVGAELYDAQQRLRNLQSASEELTEKLQKHQLRRAKADSALRHARETHDEERTRLQEAIASLDARKGELMAITRTLAQVQRYYDETKAKLVVTRRVALKADTELLEQEEVKRTQDFNVCALVSRTERLDQERVALGAQISLQLREIEAAKVTVQEANSEIEAIVFEKRQLHSEWKNALAALHRREELLSSFERAYAQEKERFTAVHTDCVGLRKTIQEVEAEIQVLRDLEGKHKLEVEFLEQQIDAVNERRHKLENEYNLLTGAIEKSTQELHTLNVELQKARNAESASEKDQRRKADKVALLQNELAEQMQAHASVLRGIESSTKNSKQQLQDLREKEGAKTLAENESANLMLLNAQIAARIEGLKKQLAKLDTEAENLSQIVDNYAIEMRRSNEELSKKQNEIDAINKKVASVLANSSIDALGPLEATLRSYEKSLEAKEAEILESQRYWLCQQNDLVGLSKKAGALADTIAASRLRLAVQEKKKALLNKDFDKEESEIKFHQRNIKKLQAELSKASALHSEQSVAQAELEEGNLGLEIAFRTKLREAELESIELERKVEDLRTEKERVIQRILEEERLVMIWEKKLQLARETCEALDPEIGAQELKEMAASIHRMELRLTALKQEQERLLRDMEQCLGRRPVFALQKHLRNAGKQAHTTNKEIAEMNRKLKNTMAEIRETDQDMASLKSSKDQQDSQLVELVQGIEAINKRKQKLQAEVEMQIDARFVAMWEASMLQKRKKRLDSAKTGKPSTKPLNPPAHLADVKEKLGGWRRVEQSELKNTIDNVEKVIDIVANQQLQEKKQKDLSCGEDNPVCLRWAECARMYVNSARKFVV